MKRLALCTAAASLVGAAVLAPVAMATTPDHGPYVVSVTGSIKGGFIETWNDSSVVYVPTMGKQRHACESAQDMSYCLGRADGRMLEELALKVSLDHHQ